MYRLELMFVLPVLLTLAVVGGALGESASRSGASNGERRALDGTTFEETENRRQREGTRLANQLGYFRGSGDGLTFHVRDSEQKYPALENLALERVGKVMSDRHDHPEQLHWNVSGFFTEYRGGNYLFITHAVLESKNRRRSALP